MHPKNLQPLDCWPQQSPIKLLRAHSFHVEFPKDYLVIDYSSAPFAGTFEGEPGHKNFVLAEPPSGTAPPTITLGGVQARLAKIHLHTPSEHDLEGDDKDVEVHLIHHIENPTSGSELIVLGVFFEEGPKAKESDFFGVWASELKAAKRPGKKARSAVTIDPRRLLSTTDRWYRYEGSLTSEPYSEVVSWVVFTDLLTISSPDLKKIKAEAHQPERPTQDINRRILLRSFK